MNAIRKVMELNTQLNQILIYAEINLLGRNITIANSPLSMLMEGKSGMDS
jgi:hypothetical protein